MTAADGLLIVDKELGCTSHDAVARARRVLGTRKVGHAGTLDPAASGVLVLGIGRATRLLGHLAGHDKTYQATIRLGLATTTDDAEGEPLGDVVPAADLPPERILAAVTALTGPIQQVPSAVSAIKVDGQRAYARVRAGEAVELSARDVRVLRFEILATRAAGDFQDLDVEVECSAGTYIRALARDLGSALGVGGHLSALRRTQSGGFQLAEAVALPDTRGLDAALTDLREQIIPRICGLGPALARCFPSVSLPAEQATRVRLGQPVQVARPPALREPTQAIALLGPAGEALALATIRPAGPVKYLAVFA
ncbi:MAG: tRNA pseudouridine(55) synthase TruB [Candidatus Nanopelagicales bacterium]